MQSSVQSLARALAEATRLAPAELRSESVQDALDVLAVAAGDKPLALVGCGYVAPDFVAKVARAAVAAGLAAEEGARWSSTHEPDAEWYRAARLAGARKAPVLFVVAAARRSDIRLVSGRRLDIAGQASALGYPVCCVREFNRQQRLLHLITLRMIARQAGNDEAQMRQLVGAQVVLAPRTATEARRLACASRVTFAPYTSVAMCRACAADPDSPARLLSARFEQLAAESGFRAFVAQTR